MYLSFILVPIVPLTHLERWVSPKLATSYPMTVYSKAQHKSELT